MSCLKGLFLVFVLVVSGATAMPVTFTDLGVIGADGLYTFDTNGSGFDTELGLWNSTGTLLGADDDGGAGLHSEISLNLFAGEYFLGISEFNSIFGPNFTNTGTGPEPGENFTGLLNINGGFAGSAPVNDGLDQETAFFRVEVTGAPPPPPPPPPTPLPPPVPPTGPPNTITTTFAGGNGQSGNMFDLVVAAQDLAVRGMDLNLDAGVADLELYLRYGPYAGFENDPGQWLLIDTVNGVATNGDGNPTFVDFADFVLPANTTSSLYVTTTNGTGMNYTNGTSEGAIFSDNGDLAILEGLGRGYPFGAVFRPRIFNGTIYYDFQVVPEPGTFVLGALLLFAGWFSFRRERV